MFITGIMHQLGAKVVCITDNQLNYEIIIYTIPCQIYWCTGFAFVTFWSPRHGLYVDFGPPNALAFISASVNSFGCNQYKMLGESPWNENLNLRLRIKFLNFYIFLNKKFTGSTIVLLVLDWRNLDNAMHVSVLRK